MSTAQILALGAVAGLTIFIGLPIGRMHGLDARLKCFLSSTATGILLFLLWDVLSAAVDPIETALTAGRDGRFLWLAALLAVGFSIGLLSLVGYDGWMKRRRRKSFVSAGAAAATDYEHHFAGLSPARWLALFIATGIGLHNFSEGLAIGQSAARDELSLALGLIIGGPTFLGTLLGQAWVSEALSVGVLALAAGSILYVVMELLNVSRAFGSKNAATLGILLGLVLGFGTDFILVAAGASPRSRRGC